MTSFGKKFVAPPDTLQYKVVAMRSSKYTLAATELLLIFPAVLFMAALFIRNVQPEQYEPAHTAQQIVLWYAARTRLGLWIFLIALPLTVLVTGSVTLFRRWNNEVQLRLGTRQALWVLGTHLTTAIIAAATLTAGGILAIVALHVLTD